jgi:two-component system NtrC family response regulator
MTTGSAKILILEDDEGLRTQYRWLLSDYDVHVAGTRAEANAIFAREMPVVAIADLGLPPDPDGATEGLRAVSDFLGVSPNAKVIVVTGNDNRDHAVKAVASGAYDFLKKPVDPELLKITVERALRLFELEEENRRLAALPNNSAISGIVGASPQMLKVLRDIEKLGKTDIAILILGESGTGKELLALAAHQMSPRKAKPFVAINCAAIPESLLEAELFGHEKGAFTGAIRQSIGKIESANGGTLFLDEIGDIPLATQVKLLRFLEDQVIERVGGRQRIKINVRIVCATNQNLTELISAGTFREDLYYRINEVTLKIPPLRERDGDIVVLANHFLRVYAKEFGRPLRRFAADAIEAMTTHGWRGNVRELENRVKRAAVMAEGDVVRAADLDLAASDQPISLNLQDARHSAERGVIDHALARANGNISKAAALLGISRPTLYSLIEEHGIALQHARDLHVAHDKGRKA